VCVIASLNSRALIIGCANNTFSKCFDDIDSANKRRLKYVSIFFLFIGSIYFISGVPMFSEDPDRVRFEQQNIPLMGFVFRIIYWVLPFLSVLNFHFERISVSNRSSRFSILFSVCVFVFCFLCGSKGAVIQFLLVHLMYLGYTGYNFLKLGRIILLCFFGVLTFYFVLLATQYYSGAEDLNKASEILFVRLSQGSGEGYYKIVAEYTSVFGFGGGWYTFAKPLYTLGATLKITSKSILSVDSGTYIAAFFRGPYNLAPYTYTIFGQGYLDFGFSGSLLYAGSFGIFVNHINSSIQREINSIMKCFKIAFGWSLISLANWGYIDGWLAYSVLTLLFSLIVVVYFCKLSLKVEALR